MRLPAPASSAVTPRYLGGLSRAGRWWAAVLVLAPALVLGWLIWRFAPDVPIVDDWSLVRDIDAYLSGTWTWADVFRSHNGHRLALPRLVLVPLAAWSGWNVRIPMGLSWVAMILFGLLVARRLRPAIDPLPEREQLALLLVGSVAWFSASQFENWLWAIMLHAFLGMGATLVALSLLSVERVSWPRWAGAAGAALAASFSHALGLLAWPVGLLVLALSPRRREQRATIVAWAALGAAVWGGYFVQLPGDASGPGSPFLLDHPLAYLYFAISFVGASAVSWAGSAWPPRDVGVGFVVGLLGLAGMALAAVRGYRANAMAERWARFAAGVVAVSFGAGALTGLARGAGGGPTAFASRYMTWSTPLWLVALLVLARMRRGARAPVPGRAAGLLSLGAAVALAASLAWGSLARLPTFPDRARILGRAAAALYDGGPDSLLLYLHPNPEQVLRARRVLQAHHLSVFRLARPPRLATAEALPVFAQRIDLDEPLEQMGQLPSAVRVRVNNPSPVAWPSLGADLYGTGAVRLASRWRVAGAVVKEGRRTELPRDIGPGGSLELSLCLQPPPAGDYELEIGLVQEGVAWFGDRQPTAWRGRVTVVPVFARYPRRALQVLEHAVTGAGCG